MYASRILLYPVGCCFWDIPHAIAGKHADQNTWLCYAAPA